MNGMVVFVKHGTPMFTVIANSITATRMIGSETERSAIRMMIKIAAIETIFTTLKSWSVMSIRSFVAAASPISIPSLS